jgi:arylsulfatase A-like enzyme
MRSQALQSLVDLAPTFMAAAGLTPHEQMQGTVQLPSWQHPAHTTRSGVLIDNRVERGLYVNSWITARYRLSVYSILAENRDEIELFDLHADPDEFVNLAANPSNAGLVAQLMAELLRYRMQIAGPWQARLTFA